MSGPSAPPPGIPNPDDIIAQLLIFQTKDRVNVQLPGADGSPDLAKSVALLGVALEMIAQIMQQMAPQEPKRIVLAPAIPKEFLKEGRLKL
jgi:hypothetical protein